VGTRVDATGIVSIKLTIKIILFYINLHTKFFIFQFAIGTLMDDYLGNGMFNAIIFVMHLNALQHLYTFIIYNFYNFEHL